MTWLKVWLFLIIILGFVIRVWSISKVPPSLTWDEAALGYNAYSILKTGRDEYGQFLPLNLKSFGDYKPAIYAYLDVPFIVIFGLNELAVRLPSVIFGTISIWLVFLIVRSLFKNNLLALLSSLMMAISPWAIQFSRGAFEANIALSLNCLGFIFFWQGIKKNKFFLLSAIFFGLSLFTYQASRLFVPMLLLGLIFFYRKEVKFNFWTGISLGLIGLAFILFTVLVFIGGQSKRLQAVNFFAYSRTVEQITQISNESNLKPTDLRFQILNGEWFAYIKGFLERYFIYFSARTAVIDGDSDHRQNVPDLGYIYFFSLILMPLGFIYLWKNQANFRMLFFWFLVAPLPAVLARDLINILRAFNMVLPVVVLEGAGLYWLVVKLRKANKLLIVEFILPFFITANLIYYLDFYFVHMPREYSQDWLYGYKQAVQTILTSQQRKHYHEIIMSDFYGQPYIYYLFYAKYSPAKFQAQAQLDQPGVDVGTVRKIDNIEFRHVFWPGDRGTKNSLFLGTKEELPDQDILPFKEFNLITEINFLNNLPAFRVVETKP